MKKENEIGFSAAVGEMKKALASAFEPRKVSPALRDNAYILKNEAYAVCSALPKKEKFPASTFPCFPPARGRYANAPLGTENIF